MEDANAKLMELISGMWRSQILYTGVKLGVFDALAHGPKNAVRVARELDVDAGLLYRLMRALGSLELLKEDNNGNFSLTPIGELLRRDHPQTLRGVTLWEGGSLSYFAWRHLADLIKEGKQDGFVREFGWPLFEYLSQNPSHGEVFNEAMSSLSSMDNALVLEALENYDFSGISHLCDIGGGHGLTLCSLLVKYPHLRGTVLELPNVIEQKELLWADRMGVGDRCTYMSGDMFREVPPAGAYMVKRVLHDWNDEECIQILSNAHKAAPRDGRVFIMEAVVPGPDAPHLSKLLDIHMLVMATGRERTTEEYAGLLEEAGWTYRQTWYPASKMLGVVEGVKA
ncbi:methyltransferase [Thermoflexus sp.]|uniref:methyltransferase n=1 Tax=Thermoflexus sp. TaxID=1969742 RepID=UPI0035E42BFB